MAQIQLPKVIIHANGIDINVLCNNAVLKTAGAVDENLARQVPADSRYCKRPMTTTVLMYVFIHGISGGDIVSHPHHTGKDMVDSFFQCKMVTIASVQDCIRRQLGTYPKSYSQIAEDLDPKCAEWSREVVCTRLHQDRGYGKGFWWNCQDMSDTTQGTVGNIGGASIISGLIRLFHVPENRHEGLRFRNACCLSWNISLTPNTVGVVTCPPLTVTVLVTVMPWCHDMETLSAILVLFDGKTTGHCYIPLTNGQ